MAKLKEYLQVGQIRKGHGLDGLIKMTLKADFTHVIDKTDHFFIEENYENEGIEPDCVVIEL